MKRTHKENVLSLAKESRTHPNFLKNDLNGVSQYLMELVNQSSAKNQFVETNPYRLRIDLANGRLSWQTPGADFISRDLNSNSAFYVYKQLSNCGVRGASYASIYFLLTVICPNTTIAIIRMAATIHNSREKYDLLNRKNCLTLMFTSVKESISNVTGH
uniref:Uncharacterized protein n=1 Tax=Romanomermis culicivorax TaxID=13658 RepID=A0A915IA60_ROMCU